MVAAWWEGWKHSTTTRQEPIKSRVSPHPSHQASILAAWWEGWKVSSTPQLVTSSSCMILFYLLLLYYTILSKSLLYNVPPVCDLTNPSPDLLSPQHYPIPTGSLGGWVKVPDHYSSIPRAPPWQQRTGSWTQDRTIAQVIQRLILEKITQPLPTSYLTQFKLTNPNPGSRVLSMAFQDPVRIFDPG
jgi:hypothetical protein